MRSSCLRVVVAVFLTYLLAILTCVPVTTSAHIPASKPSQVQQPSPQHREGELLVRFRAGVSQNAFKSMPKSRKFPIGGRNSHARIRPSKSMTAEVSPAVHGIAHRAGVSRFLNCVR